MAEDERFDAIVLKYEGMDADRALVDLGQLGASLQGASRLLGSAGHVVLTGKFARKDVAASIRVFARPPTVGSFEIVAILAH